MRHRAPIVYWSGNPYAPNPVSVYAWVFGTFDGFQTGGDETSALSAIAVHPGDVGAVPEPQTCAMLLLGIGAVLLAARRRPH